MSIAAIVGLAIASVFCIALLVALVRALATPRAAVKAPPLADAALEEAAGVEDALSAAVKRPTVSSYDKSSEDEAAFAGFKKDLERLFPKVHAAMKREEIGDRALLFTWEGTDEKLAPAIMCAHFDVVPAEDAALWRHGPFSGDIAES